MWQRRDTCGGFAIVVFYGDSPCNWKVTRNAKWRHVLSRCVDDDISKEVFECSIVLRCVWRHATPMRTPRAYASSSPPLLIELSAIKATMEAINFFHAFEGKRVKVTLKKSSYVGFIQRINSNKSLVFVDGESKRKYMFKWQVCVLA